jgi:hypothetical protein
MFCINCGVKINDTVNFCPSCGLSTDSEEISKSTVENKKIINNKEIKNESFIKKFITHPKPKEKFQATIYTFMIILFVNLFMPFAIITDTLSKEQTRLIFAMSPYVYVYLLLILGTIITCYVEKYILTITFAAIITLIGFVDVAGFFITPPIAQSGQDVEWKWWVYFTPFAAGIWSTYYAIKLFKNKI